MSSLPIETQEMLAQTLEKGLRVLRGSTIRCEHYQSLSGDCGTSVGFRVTGEERRRPWHAVEVAPERVFVSLGVNQELDDLHHDAFILRMKDRALDHHPGRFNQ